MIPVFLGLPNFLSQIVYNVKFQLRIWVHSCQMLYCLLSVTISCMVLINHFSLSGRSYIFSWNCMFAFHTQFVFVHPFTVLRVSDLCKIFYFVSPSGLISWHFWIRSRNWRMHVVPLSVHAHYFVCEMNWAIWDF